MPEGSTTTGHTPKNPRTGHENRPRPSSSVKAVLGSLLVSLLLSLALTPSAALATQTGWSPVGQFSDDPVNALIDVSNVVLAGTESGKVFYGTGSGWSDIGSGGLPNAAVLALASYDSLFWAGMRGTFMYHSYSGAWFSIGSVGPQDVDELFSYGGMLFAGNDSSVFFTNGVGWYNTSAPGSGPYTFASDGVDLYLGGTEGVARASISGNTVTWVGLPGSPGGVLSLAYSGSALWAGTEQGDVYSSYDGSVWSSRGGNLGSPVLSLVSDGATVFAGLSGGTGGGGVYSYDGTTWTSMNDQALGSDATVQVLLLRGTTLYAGVSGVTPGGTISGLYQKQFTPSIDTVEASPAALPATGGDATITVEGSDLSSLLVAADDSAGNRKSSIAQGNGTKQTAELTFPPNTNTVAEVYTVRVSTDSGQTWSQVTATVTVAPAPQVTGLTVSPAAFPSTGGGTTVTVAGTDLTDGMLVAVFDGQTRLSDPWASTTTQGDSTAQSAAVTFPPNATTAAQAYTVRVSSDNGQTWSQVTATVTVAPPPQVTGLTVSPGALPSTGGDTTVTVAGTDLTDGMLVAVFDGQTRLSDPWASTTTQGDSTAQSAALTFPPNVTTAAVAYTVRVSTDNGQTWSQLTTAIAVAASEAPSTPVADGTAARGLAQTGGLLSAVSFVVTAVLLLSGAALLAVARLRRNRQV